jgi:hypothetical protein
VFLRCRNVGESMIPRLIETYVPLKSLMRLKPRLIERFRPLYRAPCIFIIDAVPSPSLHQRALHLLVNY